MEVDTENSDMSDEDLSVWLDDNDDLKDSDIMEDFETDNSEGE